LIRLDDYRSTLQGHSAPLMPFIECDLPREIDYLRRHDVAIRRIMDTVEMPDRLAENLILYIRQNKGVLSKKRRQGEFNKLSERDVHAIERIVDDTSEDFNEGSALRPSG
jgi:hypothetical protein